MNRLNLRPRIAFVVPFLGKWPRWSRLFFQSVGANPIVDILLLCEFRPRWSLPANIVVIATSRAELVARIKAGTGLGLKGISGHKLCDFKPFFGVIFSDLLKDYEFWGFCDVDMMFGNLAKLFDSDFLDRIDLFSAHNSQVVGHFTILRNTESMNRIAFGINNWQEDCRYPTTMAVDELPFTQALSKNSTIRWVKPDILSVELQRHFCRFGITFGFSGEVAHADSDALALVEWRNGNVIYCDASGASAEVLYLHFMGLKRWWHWLIFRDKIDTQNEHRFSRIGYGGPAGVVGLARVPWRQVYEVQKWLYVTKAVSGALSRKLLSVQTFVQLRRLLFGKGRY
jgi:hypothetical protein